MWGEFPFGKRAYKTPTIKNEILGARYSMTLIIQDMEDFGHVF